MLKNAVEYKKDFALIYVFTGEGKTYGIKVTLEQMELLLRVGGKVHVNNFEVAYVNVNKKNVTLKTIF